MSDGEHTLDFLMKGGWFALEQAGRLINDALVLLEAGSYSTAAGLALLSREELAKGRELFALWMAADRGEAVTREDAVARIDRLSHVEKQRRGGSTFGISVDKATIDLLLAGPAAAPQRYEEVRTKLNLLFERLMKRGPSDRAVQRERAFYVDASPEKDGWRRPSDILADEAKDIMDDARRDYWQQREAPGIPARAADMQRLLAALERWSDRPSLPPAEF